VAIAVSPLGDQLFAVCSGSNDLYAIDVGRREVIKQIPVGMAPDGIAFAPDGLTLYVANSGTNDVSVIDVLDLRETHRAKVGSKPFSLAVGTSGQIFVVETGDKAVGVYSPDFKKLHTFKARNKPVDVTLSRDQRTVYVTDEKDNRLLVYEMP
jgi:YVTN family beta-propeller protein